MRVLLIAVLTLAVSTVSRADTTLDDLRWMAGHWSASSDSTISEEIWTAPAGGVMLGLHRDVAKSGRTSFEYLRVIEQEGAISYVAQPGGRSATIFPLVSLTHGRAVFENPDHDFPQRLEYTLEDGALCARISMVEDGGPEARWCWEKKAALDSVGARLPAHGGQD